MRVLKKDSIKDVVYLANYPYITEKTNGSSPPCTPLHFAAIQEKFTAYLLRWCLHKNIVAKNKTSEYLIPQLDKNVASLSYLLHVVNFQHFVYFSVLEEFFKNTADNYSYLSMTSIHQLHISLLMLYDPEFIEHHINKTYRAYTSLPLPNADMSWAQIHREHPFMWTVLTLHVFVKSYTEYN